MVVEAEHTQTDMHEYINHSGGGNATPADNTAQSRWFTLTWHRLCSLTTRGTAWHFCRRPLWPKSNFFPPVVSERRQTDWPEPAKQPSRNHKNRQIINHHLDRRHRGCLITVKSRNRLLCGGLSVLPTCKLSNLFVPLFFLLFISFIFIVCSLVFFFFSCQNCVCLYVCPFGRLLRLIAVLFHLTENCCQRCLLICSVVTTKIKFEPDWPTDWPHKAQIDSMTQKCDKAQHLVRDRRKKTRVSACT